MKRENLHILIEKYFDGETTLAEERLLRDNIIKMRGESPEIDEALAVMGYAALSGNNRAMGNKPISYKWIVAASFAMILIAGGIYTQYLHTSHKSTFTAYSGGVKIDRDEAMQLISIQLEEMSEASKYIRTEVEDDLKDFRNILDL